MPKPILIVTINQQRENKHLKASIKESLCDEYHILLVVNPKAEKEIEFQCIYNKDIEDVELNNIEKRITELILKQ